MEITGARILVKEGGNLYSTDLVRILSEMDRAYFLRDSVTNNFRYLCCKSERDADEKLERSGAKPYDFDRFAAAHVRKAIRSKDNEVVRSQLEGLLNILRENNLLGKEE